jgi:predicted house-cleaning noncanonical NTP pyrophosphatase (MazG superfamily)
MFRPQEQVLHSGTGSAERSTEVLDSVGRDRAVEGGDPADTCELVCRRAHPSLPDRHNALSERKRIGVHLRNVPTVGKLVRDRIPELIRADGRTPTISTLDADGYLAALLDKLVEEANELRDAEPQRRIEELADVYEVVRALVNRLDLDMAEVIAAADAKRAARGGFDARIWLD